MRYVYSRVEQYKCIMDEPGNDFLEKVKEYFLRIDLKSATRLLSILLQERGIGELDKKTNCDLRKVLGSKGKLLKCKYCHKQFTRSYGDHRSVYCTPLCHKKAIAQKRNKNTDKEYSPSEYIENCLVCGASLKHKRIDAITCSTKCRLKLNRQK